MTSAVEEVLETMYFTGVLDCGLGCVSPPEPAGADELAAEIRFQGSQSGRFRVRAPLRLARMLTACFLGREEVEVPESQAGDVVCELANMICGSILSRLDHKGAFHIGHPELVQPGPLGEPEGITTSGWFDLENGILAVSLTVQQAV